MYLATDNAVYTVTQDGVVTYLIGSETGFNFPLLNDIKFDQTKENFYLCDTVSARIYVYNIAAG